jgi:DNA primase
VIGDLGDDIERVRTATDVVAVVSRYVQLKRAGRNLKACCPFHDEKTPSFNVNPEKQIFKCFGCGAGGSVFDFLMRIERLTFVEALRNLAKEAGIELKRDKAEARDRHARDDLARVLDWAARTFAANLAQPEGEACRRYLDKRGIAPREIERFGLGFARGGWRNLLEAAERQRVPLELLLATGLALRSQEGSVYDGFRNRLMFPIRNAQGRTIAFGGRVLDSSEPKYLNSPESDVFRKRQTVYGIEGLGALKAGEPVLIMEGYTDVIMATQWGVRGAVATLGTSLTPDQVRLLRRYSDRAVLVYDGDRAGSDASIRAIPLLLSGGLDLRVVVLPGGEDPCDFFLRRKEAGAAELVQHTKELADFMVEKGAAKFELATIDGKRRAAAFFAELLAAVEDPVVRDATIVRVAGTIDVPAPTIAQLVAEHKARPAARRAAAPAPLAEPAVRAERPPAREGAASPARRKAIRDLVDVCLNRPSLIAEEHVERLPDLLTEETEAVRELLVKLVHRAWIDPEGSPAAIMSIVEDETHRRMLGSLLRDDEDQKDLRPQLEGAFRYLENGRLEREIHTLADTVMLTGSDDALRLLSEAKQRAEQLRKRGRSTVEEGGGV